MDCVSSQSLPKNSLNAVRREVPQRSSARGSSARFGERLIVRAFCPSCLHKRASGFFSTFCVSTSNLFCQPRGTLAGFTSTRASEFFKLLYNIGVLIASTRASEPTPLQHRGLTTGPEAARYILPSAPQASYWVDFETHSGHLIRPVVSPLLSIPIACRAIVLCSRSAG